MSNIPIVWIKKGGQNVYPKTSDEAVELSNGNTLKEELEIIDETYLKDQSIIDNLDLDLNEGVLKLKYKNTIISSVDDIGINDDVEFAIYDGETFTLIFHSGKVLNLDFIDALSDTIESMQTAINELQDNVIYYELV